MPNVVEKLNIYEKLSNIQNELKAPKGQTNDFGHYKYRSCEDILEATKPICKKHKVVLVLSDTLENIGDRYYIKATATLYDLESKDIISNTAYAREEESKKGMDGSQITGASSSYARKYALNGLFSIDDTKDSDNTNKGVEEPVVKTTVKKEVAPKVVVAEATPKVTEDILITNPSRSEIIALLSAKGLDIPASMTKIAEKLGVNKALIKENQKEEIIKLIEGGIE